MKEGYWTLGAAANLIVGCLGVDYVYSEISKACIHRKRRLSGA